jgi:uncharacterized RDD family membrane protein YckC
MEPGIPLSPGPAVPSLGRRFLSVLYEALLAFAMVFFAALAFYGAAHDRLAGELRLLFQIYLFLVLGVYFVACWSRGGRTLAMQTWRMRIVQRDGTPVSVGRAALRYAFAWISLLPLGAGFFWAWIDRDRQFLHDRLAGTRIVMTGDPRITR